MAFKLILDTLEGLDVARHGDYKKGEDGKFHLDVEGLEDTTALKGALQKERDSNSALGKQIKAWQGIGKTPEEISALVQGQEDLKRQQDELAMKEALAKGDYQKVLDQEAKKREQMAAKHQADLEAVNGTATRYKGEVERLLVDAQATTAIVEAKGVPQLLLPHIKGRVKVLESDGKFSVQVLDAAGNPMIADANGTPATFKHLIESFKADPVFGRAFDGSGASGGGTPSNGGKSQSSKSMARSAFLSLSPADQMAHVRANGAGSVTD